MRRTVLHLIDDLEVGGAQLMMMALVSSIPRERYRIIVCSLNNGEISRQLHSKGIEYIILSKRRPYDVFYLLRLLHLIRSQQVVLVHSHLLISHIYGWLAAKLSRIPIVITLHGRSLMNLRHGRRIFRFVARHSDRVVAVSDNIRAEVARTLNLATCNFVTIYNGVKTSVSERHYVRSANTGCRRAKGLVIGTAGSMRPVKDFNTLLESLRIVLRDFPDVRLELAGDGPLRQQLQEKACSLGLQTNVVFHGYRENIEGMLKTIDVFVLSSLTEGVSIALLEAMVASLPVVATNVGGNPEVVEDGISGFLVLPGNPELLANAITKMLRSEELRKRMGKAGRSRVEKLFSHESYVARHVALYDSVIR